MAIPFQPFTRWPLWKELGTNLDADPSLSTGTGYNAFHMDLVNATRPPDYTTLLCIRPDPLGGGPSILSDARAAVSRLTETSRALLADKAFRYGSFYELSDVGEEHTPFPILDDEPADAGFVRFTTKMLAGAGLDEAHADAARVLAAEMVKGQVSFTLQRGDFLIVDQHRCVHGREPLGGRPGARSAREPPPAAATVPAQCGHRPRRTDLLVGGADEPLAGLCYRVTVFPALARPGHRFSTLPCSPGSRATLDLL